ncbi:unnamed protein product [Mytilus coruscus]|uniref:ATP-dependent DNA helicase n=1 Tax=Mytilus coruscus TaxID=42192 RepID=A0A6J8DD24_MYTCO|nr:unnamed protein product [Mytilus coruscus]
MSAKNIHGKTLHSAFKLPVQHGSEPTYKELSSRTLQELRTVYRSVHTIVIDKISMVSSQTLLYIHRRLSAIKGNEDYFGGVNVILIGDFHQLKPSISNFERSKEYNEQQQNRLLENALEINAIHEFSTSDTVHDEDICNFIPIDDRNAGGLPNRLILSLSTRVMLIRNTATEHGLVNGALFCFVQHIEFDKNKPFRVYVRFDNNTIGRLFYDDGHHATIIEQVSQEFYYKGRSFIRTQFLITPAWASTIHKVQGITCDKIVLGLGKSVLAEGQSYVALSRVKSLNGLAIEPFDPTKIKTNQAVINFYSSISPLKTHTHN